MKGEKEKGSKGEREKNHKSETRNHSSNIPINKTIYSLGFSPKQREHKMKCNVGNGDKIFRIILGLVILAIGFYLKSWWGLVGIIPLITALMGWCPAYLPCGVSTCKVEEEENTVESEA